MYPVLSPLNQVCPPTNVQILTYVQINEAEINSVKRKYDSQLESIHKIYHQGGKSTTEIRSGGKIKKSVKDQNMILHKDNGVLRQDGTMIGGNHDRSLNSQLYGSDVLTCTAGSTMNFLLVRPNYSKGKNYEQARKFALLDRDRHNANNELDLVKEVPLDHGSICTHTAHDDERYHHGAEFPPKTEPTSQNEVRISFVWRLLGQFAYFRSDHGDDSRHRYSMVSKRGFETIEWLPKTKDEWWTSMGYVKDGNNVILPLMDPVLPKKRSKNKK
jgi:hypothetical protein